MTTTVDAHSDIWVHDYTTTTGVEVAGHWRKRRAEASPPSGGSPEPRAAGEAGDPPRPSDPTSAHRAPPPSPANHLSPSPATSCAPPAASRTARLAAAETRYKAAMVAAGVSTLRHRRGEDCDLQSTIQERSDAKAELQAARAELEQHPAPPTPAPYSSPNDPSAVLEVAVASSTRAGADRCPGCGQFRSEDHQCPTPAGLPAGDLVFFSLFHSVSAFCNAGFSTLRHQFGKLYAGNIGADRSKRTSKFGRCFRFGIV